MKTQQISPAQSLLPHRSPFAGKHVQSWELPQHPDLLLLGQRLGAGRQPYRSCRDPPALLCPTGGTDLPWKAAVSVAPIHVHTAGSSARSPFLPNTRPGARRDASCPMLALQMAGRGQPMLCTCRPADAAAGLTAPAPPVPVPAANESERQQIWEQIWLGWGSPEVRGRPWVHTASGHFRRAGFFPPHPKACHDQALR